MFRQYKSAKAAAAAESPAASCPGLRLRWDLTPEEIETRTDDLIASTKAVCDAVAQLPAEDVNYDNFVKALCRNDAHYATQKHVLTFPQHVAPDKRLRDASVAAEKKFSDFDVETSMRLDLFEALLAAQRNFGDSLEGEAKRYLERSIKLDRRNGLHLEQSVRDQIKEIMKRVSDLCIDFNNNINEDNTTLQFTREELVGLPDDFIDELDKSEDGRYKVTLQYPHYFPCAKFARNPETRKQLETAFHCRCVESNAGILEELVELKQKKADLLGFPTHAAFVLDMQMAKTPEAVDSFLTDLAEKLQDLKRHEMELFLSLKREECEKYGFEFDGKINMWDFRYYMTRVEETKYLVDENKLKEYFPLETVTSGLLDIYQLLLNVTYEEVKDAPVWQEDVKMYKVKDNRSEELLGYFYLDVFPREGKFSHAACFGLQPGCLLEDGSRQLAVAAMVANFTKPTADKPSLLTHEEVETYFHEFGHVMHAICAQADFPMFSGSEVENDFVEAPSQMLENWCWEKESLGRMSGHYLDKSPIPDDLMEALVKSRNANAGIFNLRQILLATFDQRIHTRSKVDTESVFSELAEPIMGVPATRGTNMAASFGHLADGYDAQYYGYLWSEVFSADMFHSRFKKEGILNPDVGMDYRTCILQPGGSMDASEMLKNFLGREPNIEAFLVAKGLSESS